MFLGSASTATLHTLSEFERPETQTTVPYFSGTMCTVIFGKIPNVWYTEIGLDGPRTPKICSICSSLQYVYLFLNLTAAVASEVTRDNSTEFKTSLEDQSIWKRGNIPHVRRLIHQFSNKVTLTSDNYINEQHEFIFSASRKKTLDRKLKR